jgi:hypothetical protein
MCFDDAILSLDGTKVESAEGRTVSSLSPTETRGKEQPGHLGPLLRGALAHVTHNQSTQEGQYDTIGF